MEIQSKDIHYHRTKDGIHGDTIECDKLREDFHV